VVVELAETQYKLEILTLAEVVVVDLQDLQDQELEVQEL
jgi:hypothetical protein